MLDILYEDKRIIVVWKPAGMEAQSSRKLARDMVSEIRRHIHNTFPNTGEPYVGVIHRLDKPVSGIMVYAKDKTAAAKLCQQSAGGMMKKQYLAVVCGKVPPNVDKFVDYLLKDEKENVSRIVDKGTKGAKRAELAFQVLKKCRWEGNRQKQRETEGDDILTLLKITLMTGRHHQIRVQMAGHGLPLWGDRKYNPDFARTGAKEENIALAAYRLSFINPETGKVMEFERTCDIFPCFQPFFPFTDL